MSIPTAIGTAIVLLSILNGGGAIYFAMTERLPLAGLLIANFAIFGLIMKTDLLG